MAYYFPMPFLTGRDFAWRFMGYVGGPVEYAGMFLAQAYAFPWIAALLFAALMAAFCLAAHAVLRRFNPAVSRLPSLCFALLMLVVLKRYVTVVTVLSVLTGVAAAWLYMEVRERAPRLPAEAARSAPGRHIAWAIAAAAVLVASVAANYLVGCGFLLLATLCALYEMLVRRRRLAAMWVFFAWLAPYLVSQRLYEPSFLNRYLRWAFEQDYAPSVMALLLSFYLFVPVAAAMAFAAGRLEGWRPSAPRDRWPRAGRVAGVGAAAALVAALALARLNRQDWRYADYLVAAGRWEEALSCLRRLPDDNDLIRFLALRALAHAERLPWEMFRYPQFRNSDCLLLSGAGWDAIPRGPNRRSDIYLDLGRVNDAERWAHEALTVQGETSDILERLALTNVLNGRPEAARIFLKAIERTPGHGKRARELLALLAEAETDAGRYPEVRRIQPLMLRVDYVGHWLTDQILQQCLDANPKNRMAFEYLMAHYLLNGQIEAFGEKVAGFRTFYTVLPTHFEEAILVYQRFTGLLPAGLEGYSLNPDTVRRFRTFMDTFSRFQGDRPAAWRSLVKDYGNTYWFFDVFGRTAAGAPYEARLAADGRSSSSREGNHP